MFKILHEIKEELNYEIIEISAENRLNISLNKKNDHLIIVKKLFKNLNNQILITSLPMLLLLLFKNLNFLHFYFIFLYFLGSFVITVILELN